MWVWCIVIEYDKWRNKHSHSVLVGLQLLCGVIQHSCHAIPVVLSLWGGDSPSSHVFSLCAGKRVSNVLYSKYCWLGDWDMLFCIISVCFILCLELESLCLAFIKTKISIVILCSIAGVSVVAFKERKGELRTKVGSLAKVRG